MPRKKHQPSPLKGGFQTYVREQAVGPNSAASTRSIATNNPDTDIHAMSAHRRKSIGERLSEASRLSGYMPPSGYEPLRSAEFWDKMYPTPLRDTPAVIHEALYDDMDHSQALRHFGQWPRALEAWRTMKTFMEKAILKADILYSPIHLNDRIWLGESQSSSFKIAADLNEQILSDYPSNPEIGEYNIGMRDAYLDIVQEYKNILPSCDYWINSQHDISFKGRNYPGYHSSYLLIYDSENEEHWYAIFHIFEGFQSQRRWLRQSLAIGFDPDAWSQPQQPFVLYPDEKRVHMMDDRNAARVVSEPPC